MAMMGKMSNEERLKAAMVVAGVVEEKSVTFDALKLRFNESGYELDWLTEAAGHAVSLGWITMGDLVEITEAGKKATAAHYNECG